MRAPSDLPGPPAARTETRVRYPETDRMGVAHHSHYLVWFELGRTELMRDLGCPYGVLEDRDGVFFPVTSVGADYRSPARYDERLAIDTSIEHVGGARVRFAYRVTSTDDGRELATGFTEHGATGRDGRPTRIPESLRSRLAGKSGDPSEDRRR